MSNTMRKGAVPPIGGGAYTGDSSLATETTRGSSHAMSGPLRTSRCPMRALNARSGDATLSAEVVKRRLVDRISAWLTVRRLAPAESEVGSFFRSARKNATKAISASTAITPTTVPATAAGSVESSEPVLAPASGVGAGVDAVGAAVAGKPFL